MKKTSRRSFAKSVAGALVATPLAATMAKSSQAKPKKPLKIESNRFHENTPPPISILDGSLTVFAATSHTASTTNPLADSDNGTEHTHSGSLNAGKNEITHIRVLHGSGNLLYQNLNATGNIIRVWLEDESRVYIGDLDFSGSANEFKITSRGPNRALQYNGNGSGRHKHRHEFDHRGKPGGGDFRIAKIQITDGPGGQLLFFVQAPDVTPEVFSQEYRILIWLAE